MVLRYVGKAFVTVGTILVLSGSYMPENLALASVNPQGIFFRDMYTMDQCLTSCEAKSLDSRAVLNARLVCDGRGDEIDGPFVDESVKELYDICVDACPEIVDEINLGSSSDDWWDRTSLFF